MCLLGMLVFTIRKARVQPLAGGGELEARKRNIGAGQPGAQLHDIKTNHATWRRPLASTLRVAARSSFREALEGRKDTCAPW